MARLSICVLGSFRVVLEGRPITGFVSDKARALLAYLAVEANHLHRREHLAGLLWPDYPERDAGNSLRTALANVRRVIGDHSAHPPFLEISRQTVQFNLASDSWIDVVALTRFLPAGGYPQRSDPRTVSQWEQAVDLYGGRFLEGFSIADSPPFEEWALLQGERLERQVLDALDRLVEWHEAHGQVGRALQHARRQVDLDPLRESAHRQLMRLLALGGQRAAALAQYEACRQVLREELDAEPDELTSTLYKQVQAGEITALTDSPSPAWRVINASVRPDVRSVFRNRAAEAAWLRACLAEPDVRLVSVVGRGGYGKTALVTHLTIEAESGSLRLDGRSMKIGGVAYFHPSRTGLTLGRLYADLGALLGEPSASLLASRWQDPAVSVEQKAYFLLELVMRTVPADQTVLVVLDALEQALDGTGQIVDEGLRLWVEACLASGGPIRIIVTSRQGWKLPELATPCAREVRLDGGLQEGDGVDVLRTLDPEGRCGLRDAGDPLLERAVRQTGGVPFSLLKVAGLLRTDPRLTLDTLLGDAGFFEQEITVALAERGLSHLDHDGRQVMEVLAVFGQPVPTAGVAFASSGREDRPLAESILEELARSYFVTYAPDDGTWTLHDVDAEVVRAQIGGEKLAALHRRAGEFWQASPDVRHHLAAALHFQQAGDDTRAVPLATQNVRAHINSFQAVELRRVLELLAVQQLPAEQWVDVSIAHGEVCDFLGERDPALASYQEALSRLNHLPDLPSARERVARACRGIAGLLESESPDEALEWLQRGLDHLAGAAALEEAISRLQMGSVLIAKDEYSAAVDALQQSLELVPQDAQAVRARVLGNLGVAYCSQGDLERGGECFQRALAVFGQLQDHWGEVGALHNLGMIQEFSSRWTGAAATYQQALELAERLGDVERQVELELSLGILQTKRGDDDSALAHLVRFLELAGSHLKEQRICGHSSLADLRIRTGELKEAEVSLDEAERLALEMPARARLPEVYRLRAELRLAHGENQPALDMATRSVNLARELEDLDPREEAMSLRVLGQALGACGQFGASAEAFAQSLSLLENRDEYEAARTQAQWGRAALLAGDVTRGTGLLRGARAEFAKLGAGRDGVQAERLLASA